MCHCHTRCAACDEQGQGGCFRAFVCLWGLEAYLNYLINIHPVFPLTYFFFYPIAFFFAHLLIASRQIIAASVCLSRSVPQPRPIRFGFKLGLPGLTRVCTASLCFQNDFRVEGSNVKVTFSVRYAAKKWLKTSPGIKTEVLISLKVNKPKANKAFYCWKHRNRRHKQHNLQNGRHHVRLYVSHSIRKATLSSSRTMIKHGKTFKNDI